MNRPSHYREQGVRILFAIGVLVCVQAAYATDPFPAVLTDNAIGDEPAIVTGVTYTAEPAYTNPADKSGRRLLDRDQPYADWNATVGLNWQDQTVTFDFKRAYRFSRFSLGLLRPEKPKYVDFSVATNADGPWTGVGRLELAKDKTGWFDSALEGNVTGRYVKLFFKLDSWGWYVNEAKFWGVSAAEPDVNAEMPLLREEGKLVLVKDGKPASSIVIAADAPKKVEKQARVLQSVIEKMTGAVLPLRNDSKDWAGAQILVGPSKLNKVVVPQGLDHPQGYRVVATDRTVSLIGNDAVNRLGTEYAVGDLLRQLGCGWFAPDSLYHVMPKCGTLAVTPQDRTETPTIEMRSVWNVFREAYSTWQLGGDGVECGHAYRSLVPPDEYFEEHPEYFSLVGGKREKTSQLCFSNEDVQRIVVEKVRKQFDGSPATLAASLSANDWGLFCECENCAKMGENPGAKSLAFANIIAREIRKTHPNRMVCFLAYWYTFAPPSQVKAEPNVIVMVVHQGCHAHAVNDPKCPTNVGWKSTFDAWAATGAKMAIYEWYIPGCSHKHWRKLPWVSTDVAFKNLRYWRDKGVRWITYESQKAYEDGNGYPRRWPLYYVAARGMWDPDADPRHVLRQACDCLYGPAGEAMARYFNIAAEAVEQTQVHGSIWHLPPAELIFRPNTIVEMRAAFDDAAAAVGSDDSLYKPRVATESALWKESEETLKTLPEQTRNAVDAREYNGGVWFTDKAEVTGKFMRDIVGIGTGEGVKIETADGNTHELVDDQTYQMTGGVRIVK